MNVISELITENSALTKLNEIFPSMRNILVSLQMMHPCESVCKKIDFKRFPVDATISGSKQWSLHLFLQREIGVHWVEANLQDILGVFSLRAIVLAIAKKCSCYR